MALLIRFTYHYGALIHFFAVVIEDKEIDNTRFGEEGSSNEKVV